MQSLLPIPSLLNERRGRRNDAIGYCFALLQRRGGARFLGGAPNTAARYAGQLGRRVGREHDRVCKRW